MLSKIKGKIGMSPSANVPISTSVGLELEVDATRGTYLVKGISELSPAALCGNLAIGDCLATINGNRIEGGKGDGSREDLIKQVAPLQGDDGIPVWLGVERGLGQIGAASHFVCLKTQKPLVEGHKHTAAAADSQQIGPGIQVEQHDLGIKVVAIQRGSCAWLSQQCPPDGLKGCLLEGDIIFAIDAVSLAGRALADAKQLLVGPTWSRVELSVKRDRSARPPTPPAEVLETKMASLASGGEDDSSHSADPFEDAREAAVQLDGSKGGQRAKHESYDIVVTLVRTPLVKDEALQNAIVEYREQISWLPNVPPAQRRERRKLPSAAQIPRLGAHDVASAAALLFEKPAVPGDGQVEKVGATGVLVQDLSVDLRWSTVALCCALFSSSVQLEMRVDEAGEVQPEDASGETVGGLLANGNTDNLETGSGPQDTKFWSVVLAEEICEFCQIPKMKRITVEQLAVHSETGPEPYAEYLMENLPKGAWPVVWLALAASVHQFRYDARARAMLRRMTKLLRVKWEWVACAEAALAAELIKHKALDDHAEKKPHGEGKDGKKTNYKRMAAVGGGAILGGVVIGLTGGLATPAVVAGLGVMGSVVGVGSLAASAAAFGGLGALIGVTFGAGGAGLVGYKMMKRTAELSDFAFDLVDSSPGLPVTIGVAGWLEGSGDSCWAVWDHALVDAPSDGGETFALRWESPELRKMGQLLSEFVKQQAQNYAVTVAGTAVVGAAFATLAVPRALLGLASMIDNTWALVQVRADKGGMNLASVLAQRLQGHRPVTLVGFGMGARLVLQCLLHLASMGERGRGIVETAICLGTPYPSTSRVWDRASGVCGHRLVNGYCTSDKILSLVFRGRSWALSVAGLQEVKTSMERNDVLQNVNLTGVVSGHWDYRNKLPEVLKAVGLCSGEANIVVGGA